MADLAPNLANHSRLEYPIHIGATCFRVDEQSHPDINHLVIDGQFHGRPPAVVARHPNPKRKMHSSPDAGLSMP